MKCEKCSFEKIAIECSLEKIAIVGPSGAGKTTLAKKLGPKLNIKVYHLDRFFWWPDWLRKTRDSRIDILQNLVREKQWIIEGSYINSSKIHLEAADKIIFLDISIFICLVRIIRRHYIRQERSRRDLPEGSSDRLTLNRIVKVLFFPLLGGIKLETNLRKLSPEKVVRFHSAKEVEDFLAHPEHYFSEKRESVKIPTYV